MSLVFDVYVAVPLVTLVIGGVLAAWIYTHHRNVRGSSWFLLHLVAGVGWMATFLAYVLLQDASSEILAMVLTSKFTVWAFVANIVFTSAYSESDFHRHPLVEAVLGGIVLLTLVPTWIEPFRSVFYEGFATRTEPFHYVVAEKSPLYETIGLVLAILAIYGLLQMLRYMLTTPRRSRNQLTLVVFGSLSVMLAIVVEDGSWFFVDGISPTEFGVLPYVVFVSLALFRFRLFDVLPVARNAVVEELRDPVFVLDGDRRLVDFNDAARRILPAAEDPLGEAFADVYPTLATGIDFGAEEAGSPTRLSLDVGDDTRHYSVNISCVGDDGSSVDWYSVLLRDVTDLERSRWQLTKQNERLEQVASTISHDLRNPINVADGYAELLDEQLSGDSLSTAELETARENLAKTRDSHERMLEIVDDVLTLARGRTVEETEAVSLSTTAWDAWGNVETDDATLSVTGERTLEADRSKLLSVFENLFRNSVEHGSVDVTVTVEVTDDGFVVGDDGPGIPAADRERVFEDGFTTDEDGTGLGLSIVRTMAESHGWTVELDDADGARFVFSTDEPPSTAVDEQPSVISDVR